MITRKVSSNFLIIPAVAMCLLNVSLAGAQANRTWVSPSGDDANNCNVNKPCKTFAGALAKTNAAGEIVVQESGGFGAVTIDRSVTINGNGNYAGIQSLTSTPAITVDASGGVVALRGLTLSGLNNGQIGISVSDVAELYIDNCLISEFHNFGLDARFAASTFIKDTIVRKVSSPGGIGVRLAGTSNLEHCRFEGNYFGIEVVSGKASITNSLVSGNTNGIYVHNTLVNSSATVVTIEDCVVTGNSNGLYASVIVSPDGTFPRIFYVSNTTIADNDIGIQNPGQPDIQVISFGNNRLANNHTDGAFTSSKQPQ